MFLPVPTIHGLMRSSPGSTHLPPTFAAGCATTVVRTNQSIIRWCIRLEYVATYPLATRGELIHFLVQMRRRPDQICGPCNQFLTMLMNARHTSTAEGAKDGANDPRKTTGVKGHAEIWLLPGMEDPERLPADFMHSVSLVSSGLSRLLKGQILKK